MTAFGATLKLGMRIKQWRQPGPALAWSRPEIQIANSCDAGQTNGLYNDPLGGLELDWTRITDPDEAIKLFPAWIGTRMTGLRGTFGLLLASGDVIRVTTIIALHQSSSGIVLLDVLLDHSGWPEGIDAAWRPKHFLGAPVPAATMATVNLAHVVAAVEFVAAELAETAKEREIPSRDEVVEELERAGLTTDAIGRTPE
jgi:hypothetical protein